MKTANSIIKGGQLVKANDCSYGDCNHLKIICPNCNEPLYLVQPERSDAYFAHYADKDSDCPLRVRNIRTEQENRVIFAESRGQYRDLFLTSFLESVYRSPLFQDIDLKVLLLFSDFSDQYHDEFKAQAYHTAFIEKFVMIVRDDKSLVEKAIAAYSTDLISLIAKEALKFIIAHPAMHYIITENILGIIYSRYENKIANSSDLDIFVNFLAQVLLTADWRIKTKINY